MRCLAASGSSHSPSHEHLATRVPTRPLLVLGNKLHVWNNVVHTQSRVAACCLVRVECLTHPLAWSSARISYSRSTGDTQTTSLSRACDRIEIRVRAHEDACALCHHDDELTLPFFGAPPTHRSGLRRADRAMRVPALTSQDLQTPDRCRYPCLR